MVTTPLLARAVELHQSDLRAEVARDRQARKAVVGTRTRGGFFHLVTRTARVERPQPSTLRPRPAVA